MPNNNNVWCVISPNGWAIKREGYSRPLQIFKTRTEAWTAAKRLAVEGQGHAFLQELDGKIHETA